MAVSAPPLADQTTAANVLLRLLGSQDACFWPPRYPAKDKWPAWWILRRTYHQTGVAWRTRLTGAAQKRTERALAEIVRFGLAQVTRPGSKTLSVRLTFAGDQVARSLAGMPLGVMPFIVEVLQRELLAYHDHPDSSAEGGERPWVPESIILGEGTARGWGDGHQKELAIVEGQLVAPMVHGWVDCNSDVHGRTWYRLTPSGLAVAKGELIPPTLGDLPPEAKGAYAVYWNSLCDSIAQIKHVDGGHTRDVGEVPLSAAMPTKRSEKSDRRRSAQGAAVSPEKVPGK